MRVSEGMVTVASTRPIPLILFAKAPIPGKVKTRLQTHCNADQCAAIAKQLLHSSVSLAAKCWPGPVFVSVALDHNHPFLVALSKEFNLSLHTQCEGDLGARMFSAFKELGCPAAIMGCDVPHLSADTLAAAHKALAQGKSIIGPAEDGGYYLLGLQNAQSALFADIEWGGGEVFSRTESKAQQLGITLGQLPLMQDIDHWPDLLQAAESLPELNDLLRDMNLV